MDAARDVSLAMEQLVQSAQGPQSDLARAANNAVQALNQQVDLVKTSITALPMHNVEGQVCSMGWGRVPWGDQLWQLLHVHPPSPPPLLHWPSSSLLS